MGYIRRLVTLGTPHLGSEAAGLLWSTYQTPVVGTILKAWMTSRNMPIDEGAVEDLDVGSNALSALGATDIPSYAIVGVDTGSGNEDGGIARVLRILRVAGALDIFDGQLNDSIVSVPSQSGRLGDTFVHTILGITHLSLSGTIGETQSTEVGTALVSQLKASSQSFAPGFPAPGASSREVRQMISAGRSIQPAPSALVTLSPQNGTVYHPGDTITVVATPTAGASVQAVLIGVGAGETSLTTALLESPPFSASLTIPVEYIGVLPITVMARDSADYISMATVSVNVQTSANVTSLTVSPVQIDLTSIGRVVSLQVTGHFDDGVDRDVTPGSTGTAYSVDHPDVVSVDPNGQVTALAEGPATITITNGTATDTVDVNVKPGIPQVLAVTPAQTLAGAQHVTLSFQGASLGAVSSLQFLLNGAVDGDITANSFSADSSGSTITADVSVSSRASIGPRAVVVTTPGGASDGLATFTVAAPSAGPLHTFNGAGWHLVSSPYTIGQTFAALSVNAFAYDGIAQNYVITPTPPADMFHIGQGYWIYVKASPGSLDIPGPGTPIDNTHAFTVPLKQGWNMVGEPFTAAVPLSQLSVTDSTGQSTAFSAAAAFAAHLVSALFAYDPSAGQYQLLSTDTQTFQAWDGAWVYAKQSGASLVFSPGTASTRSAAP